jgi:hypothetical protein
VTGGIRANATAFDVRVIAHFLRDYSSFVVFLRRLDGGHEGGVKRGAPQHTKAIHHER